MQSSAEPAHALKFSNALAIWRNFRTFNKHRFAIKTSLITTAFGVSKSRTRLAKTLGHNRAIEFGGDSALISIIQAAGWPIWPLVACSLIALALILERFVSLRAAKIVPSTLIDEAITVSIVSIPSPEIIKQLSQNSLLGEVLSSGFRAVQANPNISDEDLRSTIEGAGRQAAHSMERYLAALATIASAAPLLGLLGTVIGMIEIFGSQSSASSTTGGNPAQLAQGISIALYNTAFGLMIAIPTLIFWRYFRAKVDGFLLVMELASERFARHLSALRR